MSKYVLKFEKKGYICYTSHLDMVRLFNRAFKRSPVKLRYSEGYNPHPKIKFAQPLSLGYSSECELVEFETVSDTDPSVLLSEFQKAVGESITVTECRYAPQNVKSYASRVCAAEYLITVPVHEADSEKLVELASSRDQSESLFGDFMNRDKIMAMKRQKKKKELKETDIKPMIRKFDCRPEGTDIVMDVCLDAGSSSNLNPELIISSFIEFYGLGTQRREISVHRKKLLYTGGKNN